MPVKVDLTEKQIEDGEAMLKKLLVAGRETAKGLGQYTDLLTPIIAPSTSQRKPQELALGRLPPH